MLFTGLGSTAAFGLDWVKFGIDADWSFCLSWTQCSDAGLEKRLLGDALAGAEARDSTTPKASAELLADIEQAALSDAKIPPYVSTSFQSLPPPSKLSK